MGSLFFYIESIYNQQMIDTVKSCLLTGALGDAYGSRFEQSDLPAKEEHWNFTSDLNYMLATCSSISREKTVDTEKIAAGMRSWYMNQQLSGLEGETQRALTELLGAQHWNTVGKEGDSGGNSPALRIAPLAFALDPIQTRDQETIREICAITHQGQEPYAGALAVVCSIRFIQNDRQNFLPRVIKVLPDSQVKDQLVLLSETSGKRIRDVGRQFGCGNSVHESVAFAIYAAQQAPEVGLVTMMNEVVAAGGDTDANCSIAGYIAGAYLGSHAIPSEWMTKLKAIEEYEDHYQTMVEFAAFIQSQSGIQTLF